MECNEYKEISFSKAPKKNNNDNDMLSSVIYTGENRLKPALLAFSGLIESRREPGNFKSIERLSLTICR